MFSLGILLVALTFARSGAKLLAVLEDISRVCEIAAVSGARPFDRHLIADLQCIPRPTEPLESAWRSHFERPVREGAGRLVLDVDIEVRMGILPLDLRHVAL